MLREQQPRTRVWTSTDQIDPATPAQAEEPDERGLADGQRLPRRRSSGFCARLSRWARGEPGRGLPDHAGAAAPPDPADALYVGAKAGLRPLHDALLGQIRAIGAFDIAPKKGYLSLRRRKQFAMIQPSTASRIDVGLILPATTPATGGWSRRPSSTRSSPTVSASPQPLTLTTSCAAGSPPPAHWPDSHPAAWPPRAHG